VLAEAFARDVHELLRSAAQQNRKFQCCFQTACIRLSRASER
jgi:hypothetical protein